MTALFVYSRSPANEVIIDRLRRAAPGLVLLEERTSPLQHPRRVLRRPERLSRRLDRLAFLAALGLCQAKLWADFRRRCALPRAPARPHRRAWDLDASDVLAWVRGLRPGLIVVSGVSVLQDDWLQLGCPIVNIHFGLLPRDRGRFCWLWPLLRGEQDLGITLHRVEADVDAGESLDQRTISARAAGDLTWGELLAECTVLATTAAVRLVSRPLPAPSSPAPAPPRAPVRLEPGLSDVLRYALLPRRPRRS